MPHAAEHVPTGAQNAYTHVSQSGTMHVTFCVLPFVHV
jgi:hypothetical protein